MGKVEIEFNQDDIQRGEVKWIEGRKMYKVTFSLEITLFSERGDIQLRAMHNGSPVGQTTVQFDQTFDGVVAAPNRYVN